MAYYNKETIGVVSYVSTDYNAEPNKKHYYYWNFNLHTKESKSFILAYNIFSLKNFFQKRNIEAAKGIIFSKYEEGDWVINNDWSLVNVKQKGTSTVFTKYDSLNRTCPYYNSISPDTIYEKADTPKNDISYQASAYSIQSSGLVINISPYNMNLAIVCSGSAPLTVTQHDNIVSSIKPSINFYPNPTANTLTIAGLNNKGKTTLQIINTNGNVLQEVTTASSTQTIDVHSLAAGAYLLRINNGEEIITKTFIKQ